MKRNWLVYLVIFSLALNLGTIGVMAYLHYQYRAEEITPMKPPPPSLGQVFRELNLDRNQKQTLGQLFPEHRREVEKLRRELAQKRLNLFEMLRVSEPSPEMIAAKIKEINTIQCNLENEQARFLLALKTSLRPEQQEKLLAVIGQRLIPRLGRMGLQCPPKYKPWLKGHRPGPGFHRGPPGGRPPGPPPDEGPDCDTPLESGGPG
ncbi:MAG: periplasmic heavy metal sensor [Desulfobacca sp.]|nr:periplasmic heavy metal sensor [Desulfobacca sp.]